MRWIRRQAIGAFLSVTVLALPAMIGRATAIETNPCNAVPAGEVAPAVSLIGCVVAHKVDGEGNDLADAAFTLSAGEEVIGTCTTDSSGTCGITAPEGDYTLVETTPPPGYAPGDPNGKPVSVPDGESFLVVAPDFVDQPAPGTVNVHKYGEQENPLANAGFELYVDDNPEDGPRNGGDTATGITCTSDQNGDCELDGVPPGYYWLVETKAPSGYQLAPDQQVQVQLTDEPGVGDDVDAYVFDRPCGASDQPSDANLSAAAKGDGCGSAGGGGTPGTPGISLVKAVNGDSSSTEEEPLLVERGSSLDTVVTVTNTGDVGLTIDDLGDSLRADLASTCTQGTGSSLAPGASFTCTYDDTAQPPAGGGLRVNHASVAAHDSYGRDVGADDTRYAKVISPVIAITVDNVDAIHSGDQVLYTFTVTNPGDTPLAHVGVVLDACDAPPALQSKSGGNDDDSLDPGEMWTFTCLATTPRVAATAFHAASEQVAGTATASGTDVLGTVVSAHAATGVGVVRSSLTLSVTTDRPSAEPGDTVTYTYEAGNKGSDPLKGVTVTDAACAPVVYASGDTNGDGILDVGERWLYQCARVAGSSGGDLTDAATATATDVIGQQVTASAAVTISVVLGATISRPAATLPVTGTEVGGLLAAAAVTLLVGSVLVVTSRRTATRGRRRTAR